MDRALREYRIRGVATNLAFLEAVLNHPKFRDERLHHALHRRDAGTVRRQEAPRPRDQAADLHRRRHRQRPSRDQRAREAAGRRAQARAADLCAYAAPPTGAKQRLDRLGPEGFAAWMREEKRVLVTDTTMRDAHQSLLATRMRTYDLARRRRAYAKGLPQLFSLECWGGATFDVAMRFLTEDPWERLALVREKAPNILTQMLLRGANGVGYTNYPDNVVRYFVRAVGRARAWTCSASSTASTGSRTCASRSTRSAKPASSPKARSAIPATFSIRTAAKYSLRYYVDLAKELERAGCHILGLKDMAGLLKPAAARVLVKALQRGGRPADPSAYARHLGHLGRDGAGRGRSRRRRRSTRRWTRCRARPRSPASARWSRRCATPTATPASTPRRSASISFYWEAVRAPIRRLRERS